jgi:hypothetical protein
MAKAKRLRQRPVTAWRAPSVVVGQVAAVRSGQPAPAVPATSPLSWGLVARVARCGFVVVAAGVLVAGDLGTSGAAARIAVASGATSSQTAAAGAVSVRLVEARSQAAGSRAESLALARAALDAAAAADALSRSGAPGPALEVRAGFGPATVAVEATGADAVLTPEQSATLQALEAAGQVPELPAPLAPVQATRRGTDVGTSAGTSARVAESGDTAPAGEDADGAVLDDSLHQAGLRADALLADPSQQDTPPDAAPGDPGAPGAGSGSVGSGSPDAAVDGAAVPPPSDGQATAPAPDDVRATPTTTDDAAQLAAAVERLTALVAAAGGGPLGAVDELPVAPGTARVASATPAPAGVAPELSDSALTDAVRAAAGEVFAFSLRVEAATQAASRDQVVAAELTLVDLGEASASAVRAADALVELEPLTAEEKAVRRPQLRAPSRLPAGASPVVAELAGRWSNGQIPAEAMCAVEFDVRHRLQCDAADALADLNDAYRAHFGTNLALTDSYRSLAGQVAVKQAKGILAATPGTSNHGWGLAVDIAGIGGLGQFDAPGYLWLKEHAEDFGWHHPRGMEPGGSSPQEPWHWEFGTR